MLESSGRYRLAFTLLTLSSLALSGCVTHHHHHGSYRKPARDVVVAHRHGDVYVHSEHHVTLVYDSGWGGYWVRELPHHYYCDGSYFRWYAKRWHRSQNPHGPWVVIATRSLPRGLDRHRDRIERVEAKKAWNRSRFEARQGWRDDEREVREDHRADRQDARRDRGADRQESREDRRADRQDAREGRRADRQDAREGRRADRQDVRRDHRAENARTPQRAGAGAPRKDEERQPEASRHSKKKRGADTRIPADQADDDW